MSQVPAKGILMRQEERERLSQACRHRQNRNMKALLKGLLAQRLLKHRHHRGFLHNAGAAMLPFMRGRTMLLFGAAALGSEFLRRRRAKNRNMSDYPQI